VLTGTRIPRPNLTAPQALEVKERGAAPASRTAGVANAHYAAFLSRLQSAVRSGDRGAVLALVGFPLRVGAAGGSRLYPDAQSVERDYERIFTPRVRSAILRQRSDRLVVRDNRATIGQGTVRLLQSGPGTQIRITAVRP
jgi:hypothetical protein